MLSKPKVLFVAESVTLAQTVRLATLAKALPSDRYDVHFAAAEFPDLVFGGLKLAQHRLETIDPQMVEVALASGKRLYEAATLGCYIAAERELLENVQPDLVVGDFRLSLPTSCELHGVTCGSLINAYWSPYAARTEWPVPDHPIVKLVGEGMARRYFPQAIPTVFKHFAKPLDGIRKSHGLKPVGSLLEMLTAGDYTLYPDDPTLTPMTRLPAHHRFLGPVIWDPAVAMPDLDFEQPSRPLVYVTLGSSGKLKALPTIIEAVSKLPVNVVVATAARSMKLQLPNNVRLFDFVPGSELAECASLVISNGGSTTGYQALAKGTPVLGIPSNFDQFLATEAIVRSGAGLALPARTLSRASVEASIMQMLDDPRFVEAALATQRSFARHDSVEAFRRWVAERTGTAGKGRTDDRSTGAAQSSSNSAA